ncbi:MAG: VCBS repeat-containing protein, partial [Desulfuromonadales bacterium]|nr:VCBS repeat-containing protein [Desulfuromonadales bacterium]
MPVCNRLWKLSLLALVLTVLYAFPALADFREDLARDLGIKTATLVTPAGSEWLIDLDAAAGIQTGDLFAVIAKGAPIIHPVSKDVIGTLDETRAILRVTQIKTGYSYAELLQGKAGDLKPGDSARRFAGLPALFWDYTGNGESVFTELQQALPKLSWQSYTSAQANRPEQPKPLAGMEPGLVFVLNDNGLGVKDHSFQPLRFYRPDQLGLAPIATPAISAPARPVATPAPTGESILVARSASQATTVPGNVRGGLIVNQMDMQEGVWSSPRLHGHPVGIDTGDFTGDGRTDAVLCFKDRLILATLDNGEFRILDEHKFGTYGDALSLDAMDLDNDGRPEFYISAVALGQVRSLVVDVHNGRLAPVIDQIPYFMRKVHLGAEGYTLLGQELNPDLKDHSRDLSGPIFRVSRSGNSLQRGSAVSLPKNLMLFGFMPFAYNGATLYANLNNSDKLQVLEAGGAGIWESIDYFGGSEASFERPDGTYEMGSRYAFLKARIEPGPDGTLLVPVNEGNRTFQSIRTYRSSHLRALEFDGNVFVERWRTKPQGAYLADFRLTDIDNDGADEVVMLVKFSHGGWFKSERG